MTFKYNDLIYSVIVVRKNNKNTYIRIKDNKVYITTNYLVTNNQIQKLLAENKKSISKMIEQTIAKEKRQAIFSLFGKNYDIEYKDNIPLYLDNHKIYTQNDATLNKWLKEYIATTYKNHLKYWYDKFEEKIPIPNLKIRKMTTRWGVCNTKNQNITLNFELYRYDIECLDYVIVHELSHFLEPNHSKAFWNIVAKYCPNYKEIRKKLKT